MAGFRIRLDLSDFVKDVGMHRVMFLQKESILTVSDLIEKIRDEYRECNEDSNILLFIEDGFLIPSWEPIHILQQGDLVKVVLQGERGKRKRDSVDTSKGEQKKKRARVSSPLQQQEASKQPESKMQDSSEDSPCGENPKKSTKILSKVFKNPEKKVATKSTLSTTKKSVSKSDSSSDDSSDSESDAQKSCVKVNVPKSKPTVTKKAQSSSDSSESESEDENLHEKTQALKNPCTSTETLRNPRVNASSLKKAESSSSSSSDSESEDDTNSKTLKPVSTSKVTASIKPKASAVQKPESSDDSSSSDSDDAPKAVKVTKPAVKKQDSSGSSDSSSSSDDDESISRRKGSATVARLPSNCMEISVDTNISSKPLANSTAIATPASGPAEDGMSKPKRKRKRKNKNKNKLPASELPVFTDISEDQQPKFISTKKLVNSKTVFTAESEPEENSNMDTSEPQEFSAEDIQRLYAMSKPSSALQKISEKRQATEQMQYMANLNKPQDRQTEHSSTFSEQISPEKKQKKKPAIIFKPRVLNIQELKREKPVDPLCDVAKVNGSEPSYQAKVAAEKDVYTNQSKVIENPKDYNAYHAVSSGGPRVNDIIAFKMIEMSENYTPELSEFKEGKVVDIQENRVSFKILNQVKKKRNGKFELDPEEETGTESESMVELLWSEVIDPRLVFP